MAVHTEGGFERTCCACRRCTISCEHVPGALAPGDVLAIASHLGYADPLAFAREHLLASDGVPVTTDAGERVTLRTLVPATDDAGRCRFLRGGLCSIHAVAPFGCAFFDAHQSDQDYARRADWLYRRLYADQQSAGIASRAWALLDAEGRRAPPAEVRAQRLTAAMRAQGLL